MRITRILVVLVLTTVLTAATPKITDKDVARFNSIRGVALLEQEMENRAFNADPVNRRKGLQRSLSFTEYGTETLALLHSQLTVYGFPDFLTMDSTPVAALALIDSTAAIFFVRHLNEDRARGTFTMKDQRTLEERGVCKDSLKFKNDQSITGQPAGAFCTGFLVEPDVLVTAAHCVTQDNISRVRFVFGYKEVNGKVNTVFPAANVLTGTIIDRRPSDVSAEWTRVRLQRAPGPPKMTTSTEAVENNHPVSVIGCPAGTGVKFAGGAMVRDASHKTTFTANLDVFEGNSGSPVFNSRMEVVGIVARGERDWVPAGNCRQPKECPDDQCLGETITKITALPPLLRP